MFQRRMEASIPPSRLLQVVTLELPRSFASQLHRSLSAPKQNMAEQPKHANACNVPPEKMNMFGRFDDTLLMMAAN